MEFNILGLYHTSHLGNDGVDPAWIKGNSLRQGYFLSVTERRTRVVCLK